MRHAVRRPRAALVALLVSGVLSIAGPAATAAGGGIDASAVDPAVRPQDDLFLHANGDWLRSATIPADRASAGVFEDMADRTLARLRALIEAAGAEGSEVDAQKLAALYNGFMDEAALEPLGLAPLAAELQAIDAVVDGSGLAALFARLDRLGVTMPVTVSIDQDARHSSRFVPTLQQSGLGLPNRDYYLVRDDARFGDARAAYLAYMTRLLTLAQTPDAAASAEAVLALETGLARIQWSEVANRDPVKTYNRTDLADLPEVAPILPWGPLLAAAGVAGRTPDVIVAQPDYFAGLSRLLAAQPLAVWKAYARVQLISAYAPFMSHDFVAAQFAFAGTALRGTTQNTPRWQRGVRLVDQSLGDALGKRYVLRWFPATSKARIEEMVANLLLACRESIATRGWMAPATRREALVKLAKFTPKIAYPERWIDYSRLDIRPDDLVGNVMRARTFASDRYLSRLGRPVDRTVWEMTPQTLNAYYGAPLNEIVFPAAILQAPAFDAEADDAVNYGGIGAIIGHEISHGFDDEGSQFDGDGNLRNWWTPRDRARFLAKTRALVAQYAAYSPLPGYFINGELTLGENIADNAGLEIAYRAWKLSLHGQAAPVIGGLSGEQRFFIAFAQVWRSKMREAATLQLIKSDPHSPDEFRANGTARNHPGFYTAFGVKPGDGMYLAPNRRVSLW